jgi:hypothetical protein
MGPRASQVIAAPNRHIVHQAHTPRALMTADLAQHHGIIDGDRDGPRLAAG